jgi:hypothetical protein
MFLSRLKIRPTPASPAAKTTAPEEGRTGETRANRNDDGFPQSQTSNTRGAIGTLAAIALLMWFIAFFLFAGPGIGLSDSSGGHPSMPPASNVVANHP